VILNLFQQSTLGMLKTNTTTTPMEHALRTKSAVTLRNKSGKEARKSAMDITWAMTDGNMLLLDTAHPETCLEHTQLTSLLHPNKYSNSAQFYKSI